VQLYIYIYIYIYIYSIESISWSHNFQISQEYETACVLRHTDLISCHNTFP